MSVLYGTGTGLSATANQLWSQASPSVLDAPEAQDNFGSAVAGGDLGNGVQADLVVGVPFEGVGSLSDAGVVHVLYGTATGLSATGNQLWSQDSGGNRGDLRSRRPVRPRHHRG